MKCMVSFIGHINLITILKLAQTNDSFRFTKSGAKIFIQSMFLIIQCSINTFIFVINRVIVMRFTRASQASYHTLVKYQVKDDCCKTKEYSAEEDDDYHVGPD